MNIITGMHRSGTSFTSQCLQYLNADFGTSDNLMPADKWNQQGYLEDISVLDINNRLILGNKAKIEYWLAQPENRFVRLINSINSRKWKYFLFPPIENIYQRRHQHSQDIQHLMTEYNGKFVKDPRFCLTLRIWLEAGQVDSLVFCFRHPESVARSIRRRESLPLSFGYKYWLYHVKGFLDQVPENIPITFVNFDEFFEVEKQLSAFTRLATTMQMKSFDFEGLKATLNIKLRTQEPKNLKLPHEVEKYYGYLTAIHAESTGPIMLSDYSSKLDAIR